MSTLFIKRTALAFLGLALVSSLLVVPELQAQKQDEDKPLFQQYRGIQLGMAADEVRKKLGSPADKGDEQDFYSLNDAENAQIFYDKTKKVMAISANFLRGARDIPTPNALFGGDVTPKPDGSVYKMVRYTKAGYWLSYSKTAGDSPMISVTLQKIE